MTIESLSTLLLTLTGPIAALALALGVLSLRPLGGAQDIWVSVWLVGLAVRFGKSTLNALLGLDPWALNLGLAGMLAAPAALYLANRAAACGESAPTRRDLWHFMPALAMAAGSPWIPNERGDAPSALIYIGVLALWALYLTQAWRALLAPAAISSTGPFLLKLASAATTVFGALFVVIFAAVPALYLLNAVLFSLAVVAIAAQLIADRSALRGRRAQMRQPASSAEQRALTERVRRALADPSLLADVNTNLARVARKLGVAPKTLSSSINSATGDSFTTMLNATRIAEAQRQLRATCDSIESIAARCGFSAASTFHRTFRRHVGTTPAAWRDSADSRAGSPTPIPRR